MRMNTGLLWRVKQISNTNRMMMYFRRYSMAHGIHQRRIRNIGIIAHVDAGKTTTTERMLYFAGAIQQLGNVDRGDTVMDYLDEERNRGITINAASTTFRWRRYGEPHLINLIDTPGHVDFAAEVERSLFVLDGAVVILDSSAGVEAQTLSVTQRAKSYKLPIVGYLNKLDKPTANLAMCLQSIRQQLAIAPLMLHHPVFDRDKRITGIVDLVNMKVTKYDFVKDPNGNVFTKTRLIDEDSHIFSQIKEARHGLVESVANLDDSFAESYLVVEDPMSEDLNDKLFEAIGRNCVNGSAMPVFAGSSIKNVGVQPLMDGIVDYLPSPVTKKSEISKKEIVADSKNLMCGLIFKTIHHKLKGHLAYCRIYTGSLMRGTTLFMRNNTADSDVESWRPERVHKVYQIMADELAEIEETDWGDIVAISGLKQASTGMLFSNRKLDDGEVAWLSGTLPLNRLRIPPPVFSCTIEVETSSQQSTLENALEILAKEDPSIKVTSAEDEITHSQSLAVSGLGELHLEIIKHRLEKDFKLKTVFGPLQISYFECITKPVRKFLSDNVTIAGQTYSVVFDIELIPNPSDDRGSFDYRDFLNPKFPGVDIIKDTKDSQIEFVKYTERKALNLGLESACRSGPIMRQPIQTSFKCRLYAFAITQGTSMAILTATFSRAVRSLLAEANPILLEPHMKIEIQVEKPYLSDILSDLASRQAVIESIVHQDYEDVNGGGNRSVVRCSAPLRLLRGYATSARVIASGRIGLAMELEGYRPVTNERDLDSIRNENGYILPSSSHS